MYLLATRTARLTLLLLLWAGLVLSASPLQAAEVDSLRSYRAPDHTRLVFDLDAPVSHQVFTLDNPDRVVIDLSSTRLPDTLDIPALADTPIAAIRTGVRDNTDLRVVLDLHQAVQPRSFALSENDQYGYRLVIDLYDSAEAATRAVADTTSPDTAPVATASRRAAQAIDEQRRDIVIAISAGHGGEDPGAIGVGGLREKDVALAFSRALQRVVDRTPGYRAIMIRDGDYYVGLRQQADLARQHNADLFVSLHADAFTNPSANGTTIYALSQRGATSEHARRIAEKENSADLIGGVGSVSLSDKDEMLASVLLDLSMTASITSSLEVGDRMINALGGVTRMRRSNVEQAAFMVLKSADVPSLLIETGYITNPDDARRLKDPAFQQRFTEAMFKGIREHFWETPPRGTLIAWQKSNGQSPGLLAAAPGSYTVSSGDSLSLIASRYGVSVKALKSANGLSSNTIRIGQTLTIPGSGDDLFREHTISRGETLSGIANSYHVSLDRIRETNHLNSDTIRVGQVLRIPST